jgi:hypothetical protein
MKMNGYCGKMLFVNFTDGALQERELTKCLFISTEDGPTRQGDEAASRLFL